jgi:hypothetical protein
MRAPGNASEVRVETLNRALRGWQGSPLVDLADSVLGVAEATRLPELRRTTEENLFQARLELGDHHALVGDLEAAVTARTAPGAALEPADAGPLPLRPPGRRPACLPAATWLCLRPGRAAEVVATARKALAHKDYEMFHSHGEALSPLELED